MSAETPSLELRKFVVPEFIFGIGARHKAGIYAHNVNAKRCLIVSDPGVSAAGRPKGLEDSLVEHAARDVCIYTNPRRATKSDLKVLYEEAQ